MNKRSFFPRALPSLYYTSRERPRKIGRNRRSSGTHGHDRSTQCQRSDAMIAPWAEEEMVTVDLGDERLDARVVVLLSSLGDRPNLSIPAACLGRAEIEAAYRFFDNDKVTFEK